VVATRLSFVVDIESLKITMNFIIIIVFLVWAKVTGGR
jgi:hypothetical protein